jgi:hypothetical protein
MDVRGRRLRTFETAVLTSALKTIVVRREFIRTEGKLPLTSVALVQGRELQPDRLCRCLTTTRSRHSGAPCYLPG